MALTDIAPPRAAEGEARTSWLSGPIPLILVALLFLGALGWQFLRDPTISAPTRDPAWYTWRANVVLSGDPGSVAGQWGPAGLFSGGYRISNPLAGALLERVGGIDVYTFSAFMMLGIPILAGLAIGAAAYRRWKDPLAIYLCLLASVALFLTTPYVGYLDDTTMLFILCAVLAFVGPARTSWGARIALFLLGLLAAFTHPTTSALFGFVLMGVFIWHVITGRSVASAFKSDAPMLWAVGSGMILGLAMWPIGPWGTSAKFSDAALPPPYGKSFFLNRLAQWIASMNPFIVGPLILAAFVGIVLMARRKHEPAGQFEMVAMWWLLPLAGILLVFVKNLPYYRFVNATAAPIALTGVGAFIAIKWFLSGQGSRKLAGAVASFVVIAALGWLFVDGLQHRWVSENNQWASQETRIELAAVHQVVQAAGTRPNILIVNFGAVNTGYGWAKTDSNVFRTGIPGQDEQYSATYFGTVTNFLAGQPTTTSSAGYNRTSAEHFREMRKRTTAFPAPPVVFLLSSFYKGADDLTTALAKGTSIGPGVSVITGSVGGPKPITLWTPPQSVISAANQAAQAQKTAFADAGGPFTDPLHTLRVLVGLFFLAVLPGLLAAPFFELDDWPSRLALVPAMSICMTLITGIVVLSVWRGPLSSVKGWAVVVLACGAGAVLRFGREPIVGFLASIGAFFNKMMTVFSNRDYATLMGVQFAVQAAQGGIAAAIAKLIVFGGQKGFDASNVPTAQYLLKVVLALYVPYTIISPFIGVFIDRFERRRVLSVANLVSAALVGVVAIAVMLPLGKGTSEGHPLATVGLVFGLLVAQAVVRIALAAKSAAIPDVLSGRDLLQGNGLSQAGGALFQVLGIGLATGLAALFPAWFVVLIGAVLLVFSAWLSMKIQRMEVTRHEASFSDEARQVVRTILNGLKEVAGKPAAALGLSSFQMLRYQFWGFSLFVFALWARTLVTTPGKTSPLAIALPAGFGFVGGALGMILAQKFKDKIAPVRILLGAMVLLGAGTILFGGLVSKFGFALQLFVGFFAFFVGKISADTIMQQAIPDDFRGRAFALFDIAYNLGFIVPALILDFIWKDNRARPILLASGAVFLVLTFLVSRWADRIRDQLSATDRIASTV